MCRRTLREALQLMEDAQDKHIEVDMITCNAAITACHLAPADHSELGTYNQPAGLQLWPLHGIAEVTQLVLKSARYCW